MYRRDDHNDVQCAFDTYCKRVITNAAKNAHRLINLRIKTEVTASDLSNIYYFENLRCYDHYPSNSTEFQAGPYSVIVNDERLAKALVLLPEIHREIILLYWFLDMSDEDVGEILRIPRSTIYRKRKKGQAIIKNIMEAMSIDE